VPLDRLLRRQIRDVFKAVQDRAGESLTRTRMETHVRMFGISQLCRQARAQIRRAIQSCQVYRAHNSTTSASLRKTTQNRSTGRPERGNLLQRNPGINTTEARWPRRSCGYRRISCEQFTRQDTEKGANAESVRATWLEVRLPNVLTPLRGKNSMFPMLHYLTLRKTNH